MKAPSRDAAIRRAPRQDQVHRRGGRKLRRRRMTQLLVSPPELRLWVNLRHSQPCPECLLLEVKRTKSGPKQTSPQKGRLGALPANGLRGSWWRRPAFEALSCGCKMGAAAGCACRSLVPPAVEPVASGARRGRLARAAPHGSPGAQEGPCAGQEGQHQERQRRPGGALFAENCPRVYAKPE